MNSRPLQLNRPGADLISPTKQSATAAVTSRVLVADDDSFCRRAVGVKLKLLGSAVVEAEDGVQAFELLKSQKFDLAIVDLEMPKLSGNQLISCARGFPNTKKIPIVVLTSRSDREAIEQALVAGATSFLIKPLNWAAFGAHIEHLLQLGGIVAAQAARSDGSA
jgi:CheY-like chemotaxis protein